MKRIRFTLTLLSIIILVTGCNQNKENNQGQRNWLTEKYRPQFHYSPKLGWMNDPNGLVFYEGEYHLFYQYNPDSTVWGKMHWGHAVSNDMIHWEELPIAIYPDSLGWIFSGSAVVDWENTAGFSDTEKPALVAIYTYHDMEGERQGKTNIQSQGIAYSLDSGRTWKAYAQNPVIPNPNLRDFRDPKVSWNENANHWVMSLAVQDHIEFYGSIDLKTWVKLSEYGKTVGNHKGVWECPDLFPLTDVEGNKRWILFVSIGHGGPQGGSATQYFIGDFDGKNFSAQDTVTRWIDYGADNYAGVTWSDVLPSDGRRLFIGWMSNWQYANVVPTKSWRSAMTLPREINLIKKESSYELKFTPVKEINSILREEKSYSGEASYELSGARITIQDSLLNSFQLILRNSSQDSVVLSSDGDQLIFDRRHSGVTDFHTAFPHLHNVSLKGIHTKKVDVFVDACSVEIFLNDGERVLTELIFPAVPFNSVQLKKVNPSFTISPIQSPWN